MSSSTTSTVQQTHDLVDQILEPTDEVYAAMANTISCTAVKEPLQSIHVSTNESQPLTSNVPISSEVHFILFPMLPVELRLRIWRMALPAPRIVEVYLGYVPAADMGPSTNLLRANTPPPTLMSVNFESRSVALEKYWLRFGKENAAGINPRIDPAEDTIFVSWLLSDFGSRVQDLANGKVWSEEAKESIRYLAIDERTWRDLEGSDGFVYFENLERFTVVAHQTSRPCLEGWENRGLEVSLVDLEDEDREEEIQDRIMSVVDQFDFDNEYYKQEWKVPVVEVKVVARRGQKCCY